MLSLWSWLIFFFCSSSNRPPEDLKPSPLGINEISSSFFSLLLEILLLEGQASLPLVSVWAWATFPAKLCEVSLDTYVGGF